MSTTVPVGSTTPKTKIPGAASIASTRMCSSTSCTTVQSSSPYSKNTQRTTLMFPKDIERRSRVIYIPSAKTGVGSTRWWTNFGEQCRYVPISLSETIATLLKSRQQNQNYYFEVRWHEDHLICNGHGLQQRRSPISSLPNDPEGPAGERPKPSQEG